MLKEFKVDVSRNKIAPVTVKNNPFGELFSASRTDSLAVNFKNTFLANLSSLLTDRDSLSINVGSDSFNNGESHASGSDTQENNFAGFVGTQFRSDIQNRATALGSSLTSNQVIARATALTCGGCHQPAAFGLTAPNSIGLNQNWPDSLGFVHVSERIGADGKFPISPALQTVFIPARKKDFEGYLNSPN